MLHLCNYTLVLVYSSDIGIYEDTPKTQTSIRWVTLPSETISLLQEWGKKQNSDKDKLEGDYLDRSFLFAQDDGSPMHPDSLTTWLDRFAKRHGLRHINPHAFRHSMASLLCFNGVDSVSISKRLGHAQVSTTADIYAHIIEAADQRSADIIENIFLKRA